MTIEEHDRLDDRCVAEMLGSSTPEGRVGYQHALSLGTEAYTFPVDYHGPRAYAVPCSATDCYRTVLVLPGTSGHRRFCSSTCRSRDYYRRHPGTRKRYDVKNTEKRRAYQADWWKRNGPAVNADRRRQAEKRRLNALPGVPS